MQTHVIPYSLVGFVHAFQVRIYTCISRSREHKCPNYVPLEGKMICPYWYTHEDIRDFESNNSIKCCHEVRIGRQNVHAFQVRIYTCISRSREHKCPNYVPLEGKMICPYWYTHEDIRDFESNNSIKCCHEVRIGRQNVHANKVYSGKEKKKGIPYPNLQKVSGLLCPSL